MEKRKVKELPALVLGEYCKELLDAKTKGEKLTSYEATVLTSASKLTITMQSMRKDGCPEAVLLSLVGGTILVIEEDEISYHGSVLSLEGKDREKVAAFRLSKEAIVFPERDNNPYYPFLEEDGERSEGGVSSIMKVTFVEAEGIHALKAVLELLGEMSSPKGNETEH